MKSDRQTYMSQYSPSGGLAQMIIDGFPLARGDTDSEGITQTIYHCDPDALSAVCLAEVGRSRSHPERSEGSATVYQILRPEKAGTQNDR